MISPQLGSKYAFDEIFRFNYHNMKYTPFFKKKKKIRTKALVFWEKIKNKLRTKSGLLLHRTKE